MNSMLKYIIVFLMIFLFVSCQQSNNKEEKKIFRYNESSGINSLDPAFAKDQAVIWVVNQLYNGLVQINSQLEIIPCIAKRWAISEDGLTYTFFLREDVYFHDHELFEGGIGRRVVAKDFEYSFNRIINPKTASPGAWIFNGRVDTIQPFHALDDTTFQIRFLNPFLPFVRVLAMQYCSVVPKEIVKHYGNDFRKNPVGTGPFKFNFWEENVVLTLVKNEKYFEQKNGRKLPLLDGVKITFADNKHTAFLNFMSGELDFISGLDQSFKDDVLDAHGNLKSAYNDKITLYKVPYLNTEYLGFLMNFSSDKMKDSPLRHKEVRQAINFGFNRKEMIAYLRNNIGMPATSGFVPKGLPSFNASKIKGYTYDPEKARKLLQEAGYPNGKGLPKITLFTNPSYVDFCTYIQKQLADININIQFEVIQPGLLRDLMARHEAPFFRGSWIADYASAESFLAMFYGKNPAPPNYTGFKNSKYDELYELAVTEQVDAVRYGYYQQLDQILVDEAPVVPLFYDEVVRFTHKNIIGLENNAINLLVLKNVDIINIKN